MKRTIITIDEGKCNGCGLCVNACHEGALKLVNGKARLVSESYCDGLGDCLPACPTGAIVLEERECDPYDEEAVRQHLDKKNAHRATDLPCGCPGTQSKLLEKGRRPETAPAQPAGDSSSELRQWPCQLKLVPPNAPYFANSHLLVAADCTAFAYANIHRDFMKGKITLIGCPKLDNADYSEKLAAILKQHDIKSISVLRMEVPCCGGLVNMVKKALSDSGQMIPWSITTVSTDGNILAD